MILLHITALNGHDLIITLTAGALLGAKVFATANSHNVTCKHV